MLLPKVYKFLGIISIGTLHRWICAYEDNEDYRVILPNYKYTKQGEYNTILTQEMKDIYKGFEMVEVERLNGINNKMGANRENKMFKELLIANYPIKELHNDQEC